MSKEEGGGQNNNDLGWRSPWWGWRWRTERRMMVTGATIGWELSPRNLSPFSCVLEIGRVLPGASFWPGGWKRGWRSPALPCSERRGGGGKPGEEEPGGKEDGAHSSFENHCFHSNFWFLSLCSYFDQQELWSETIHCWLTAE